MSVATTTDRAALAHLQSAEQGRATPAWPGKLLTNALCRLRDRRLERTVRELDHPGVLDDFLRATRGR